MAAGLTGEEVQELYRQHGPALLAYGTSLLGDFAAAEDVLQQLFLRLLTMKAPREPRLYLFKAVRNRCLNVMRGNARLAPLDPREWLIKPQGMAEAGLEVEKAVRELPPEQREAVVMRIWCGMTLAEIASVLEIPLNTAASRYRYALEKLRGLLKETR